MARKKIREYDAKQLIAENIEKVEVRTVLVTPDTNLDELPQSSRWLLDNKLVIKPDQLFGKRKKLGLVHIGDFAEVKRFIEEKRNKDFTINKSTDKLTHFLIEPYIEHEKEFYLAIRSERDHDLIYFSEEGGIEIEENWEKVKNLTVPTLGSIVGILIDDFLGTIDETNKQTIRDFINEIYRTFQDFDFTYLEFNPFTIKDDKIILLDTVAIVDDCAAFKNKLNADFPRDFGQQPHPEEAYIEEINKHSGSSLKLTILNPNGRIWNILSGGGASIIYLDTIADLGKQEEIANYGEYSGNPSTEESYQYAKTVLDLMTREPHPEGKILIIAGGIANFTDVEKTFKGIEKALREYQDKLRAGNVSIFVRRGGPNYEKGLKLIEAVGKEINLPMQVYGPDSKMVDFIPQAMERL